MTDTPRIAIDAMGGDEGVTVMVEGAALALGADPTLRFLLIGDESAIAKTLSGRAALKAVSEIIHAPEVISGTDKPTQAIRRAKTTSMGLAIDAVKCGRADAALSGGNTGALMAMSKLALRTLPGIDRPALAALLPTLGANDLVMLDLGANTECDANNLVEFAVMGAVYARVVMGLERPRVFLLNIGEEEMKGTGEVKEAAARLRAASGLPLDFQGYIEADRLGRGEADVIVSDGFTGNIALKSVEGTARFITDLLRRAFTSSLRSKAGFLLSRPAFHMLKTHLDPNNHNGAVFLGLNGVVVKSHGGADAGGVANAIAVAAKLARASIAQRIAEDLSQVQHGVAIPVAAK